MDNPSLANKIDGEQLQTPSKKNKFSLMALPVLILDKTRGSVESLTKNDGTDVMTVDPAVVDKGLTKPTVTITREEIRTKLTREEQHAIEVLFTNIAKATRANVDRTHLMIDAVRQQFNLASDEDYRLALESLLHNRHERKNPDLRLCDFIREELAQLQEKKKQEERRKMQEAQLQSELDRLKNNPVQLRMFLMRQKLGRAVSSLRSRNS